MCVCVCVCMIIIYLSIYMWMTFVDVFIAFQRLQNVESKVDDKDNEDEIGEFNEAKEEFRGLTSLF